MPPQIHLIRHAESAHNVSKDFSIPDPSLTPLGITQSQAASHTYPFLHTRKISVVISSPLRRALQTTLYAFSDILDKRYYEPTSPSQQLHTEGARGVDNGILLKVDANLQERSDLPCDTGSSIETLRQEFPGVDFSVLGEEWPAKKGVFAADDEAVKGRAGEVRVGLKRLVEEDGGDVVVVTHGVFMKFLTGDSGIDLVKAGWRSYHVSGGEEGVVLVAV